jgi:hypothetical protein
MLGTGQRVAATFAIGDKLRGLAAGAAFTNSSYQPNARTAGAAPTEQLPLSF